MRATAEKILAVPLNVRVALGDVPAVGASRRLQGLYALGHRVAVIADLSGISTDAVGHLVAGRWTTIKVAADSGIREAYAQLSMQTGPSSRTRKIAQQNGWAPPLAWDEDAIDDPEAAPLLDADVDAYDEVAVRRYADGARIGLTAAERLDAVALCVSRGMSYEDIDREHGHGTSFTCVFVGRMRRAYQHDGRTFPAALAQDMVRVLEESEVVAIRTRSVAGETDLELGMAYGVRARTIAEVCRGRSYRQYGGPIRAPKTTPSGTSKTLFAGKTGQRAA
jgi:transposase-like protein